MAKSKISVEALSKLIHTLKQAWSDIAEIKLQVDHICYGFIWDDPVGQSFIAKYEKEMAPIKNILLPQITSYSDYLEKIIMNVGEYADISGGVITGVGFTIASGRINVDSNEQQKTQMIDNFLKTTPDGSIIWEDERFKKLEKENYDFLNSEKGQKALANAKKAFSGINDLSLLTVAQLHMVVGGILGLNNIRYKKEPIKNPNILGSHPWNSNEAILNKNQIENMPMCEQIATFAHEGRHIYQDIVAASPRKDKFAVNIRRGKASYVEDKKTFKGYYNNTTEIDARRTEIIVGKVCTEHYNDLIKRKLMKPRVLYRNPN